MDTLWTINWQDLSDPILLHLFSFFSSADLRSAAQTCHHWYSVALDESLWKDLVCHSWKIEREFKLPPGKLSWRDEYRRLEYHCPTVETETLIDHSDEVLHVSFAHNGGLFATTSKDASVKVWQVGYPTQMKHSADMKQLRKWDFTQFTCFNSSDTALLVSGVIYTSVNDRRGYLAVFSLRDFSLLQVTTMDPSQLFGTWLSERTFLGGSLEINLDRFTTSVQIDMFDTHDPMRDSYSAGSVPILEDISGQPVFTFCSENACLIKFLTVAESKEFPSSISACEADTGVHMPPETACSYNTSTTTNTSLLTQTENSDLLEKRIHRANIKSCHSCRLCASLDSNMETDDISSSNSNSLEDRLVSADCKDSEKVQLVIDLINYNPNSLDNGSENCSIPIPGSSLVNHSTADVNMNLDTESVDKNATCREAELCDSAHTQADSKCEGVSDNACFSGTNIMPIDPSKFLIFVTGEIAEVLHQIGIKFMTMDVSGHCINGSHNDLDLTKNDEFFRDFVINFTNNDIGRRHKHSDETDILLDLQGHVTGLSLSPDHRYLYVNCRPWLSKVNYDEPFTAPRLSEKIEVRVIDLTLMKETGARYHGHIGYSPATRCCFIFLDVAHDYIASGSEDCKGYLWDRHYGCLLSTFKHGPGVVNATAFNPKDQSYLVTVSDDNMIKIWRSKYRCKTDCVVLEDSV